MAKYTVEKALEDRKKRQQEEKYNALYQAALESPGSVARSHTPMTVEEALEERIKERKRNADSYKSDIVKQYNSLVENYGKYSKYKPFYGVDATKNTRIRQTGISGDISNLITKVEGNRDILGDEDADLILKNLNNMKSGLANEVDASKVLTNFTDEKDLDDFMNPPGITPLIPKGALAPFGGKDSTPVKKDVGGIYQFDSQIDNSGLDKLMFGSSKTKEPLSTDDVKDEDRLAIYAYYTQKAREAEKSGASEEEVNALLKQAEKARSKEGYQEIMNGWLNNDFELDTETVEARRLIYDRKIAEIERLKTQINATPDGEEKDNLVKRKEALEAETRRYEDYQKDVDDSYYLRNESDFSVYSANKDKNGYIDNDYYTNLAWNTWTLSQNAPTEIRDEEGRVIGVRDALGNEYSSMQEYAEYQNKLYSDSMNVVEDKLGLYLSLSPEERRSQAERFTDLSGQNITDNYNYYFYEGLTNNWDELTQEEIDTYYYLYNKNGKEAAVQYLDSMQRTLNYRAYKKENEQWESDYNNANALGKILMSIGTVGSSMVGGITSFVSDVGHQLKGERIDPYDGAHSIQNQSQTLRYLSAKDIEEMTGGANLLGFSFGDAYQAVMSGADSLVGGKLIGRGFTAIMGMSAASTEAKRLYEMGASNSQIFWGSLLSGAAEVAFEYISLDHFLKQTSTKSFKELIKQALIQGGIEASEEFFTEIANTMTNAWVMKSQSDWKKLEEEGGFKKAFLETVMNVINAGIGGFISGAGMAAGQGGVNLAMYNSYANGVGAEINSLGNGQALLENANALSEEGGSDAYIRKLSKKVAEAQAKGKTDTLLNRINTGKLYDTVAETRAKNAENADRNTFKTFVSDAIKDNADIKNKAKAAEILTKSVYDNKLSPAESLYYNKIGGKEIINSVLNDKTLPSSQKLNNILSKMALSQTEALRYESQGKQDAVATSKIKDVTNKIDNGEIKVADAQKTESAKAAEIVNIKSVKDGVMTFEMSDGTEVSSNDITYKSKDEGLLYESILAMGFNEGIGNTIVKNLASSGMSVKAYLNNVALAYDYGVTGQQARIDEVLLPKELRNTLYVVGRDAAKANTERLIAKAREEKAVGKATNKVTYVNDIGDKSKLNNNQKATVAVAEFIAASSPLDVRIYKSFRRGNKTYININGVEQESYSNGWYAEGSNIIYIDINAGNSYEGLGVYTLAHEISHYIRHWNAEEWQQMADFIVEVIDKQAAKDSKYATFEYSLNKKFQEYKSKRKADDALIEEGKLDPEKATYGGKTDTKLRDMAYEDVICDSLASLFQDKQTFVEFSDNLKKTNPSLWEKFKQAIKKFLDKLDNVLKEFAGVRAESEAGQAVQDALKEDRDRIRELFTAAFGGANENFEKASRRGEPLNVDKNSTKSVTHKKSPESKLNSARDTLEERTAIEEMGDNLKDVIRDKDGNMLVATSKDGSVIRYSERTYNNGGKTALIKCLRDNGHTTEEISDTLDFIDRKLKVISNYGQEFASQYFDALNKNLDKDVTRDIATGNQVIFAFTPNGDYPANMDLQLECKKRIAYGEIMKRLIADGVLENVRYGGEAIAEVNMILAENEFETACLGCFVESRRLQFQAWAETFVTEYNEAVARFNPNADYFFGKEGNAVSREDAMSAFAMLEGEQRNDKGNLKLSSKGVANKMSELIAKNPKLFAHKLSVADILTPEGLKKLRSEIGGGDIFSLLKQRYGAASPKIVQDFNPYNSEILNLTFATLKNMTGSAPSSQEYIKRAKDKIGDSYNDEAADIVRRDYDGDNLSRKDFIKKLSEIVNAKIQETAFRDYLFDVGGLRIQSFSDFMIENTFDMLQMFTDMSVKEFPIHGYTKEISCIRLFGMTGAKFNGSLIAHVDRSLGKRLAGLMEYTPENARHGITVDLDGKKYVIQFDDFERNNKFGKFSKENPNGSFIQSIGYKDIIATMLDPRYSKNIGNITIGVSDAQIKAMLRNPLFRMIIPYHSSGMIPGFAELVGVSYYNDYTDFQNTTVRKITDLNGKEIKWHKDKSGKYTAALDGKTITVHFDTEFNFNEEMNRVGDAKQAASNYVAWCDSEHEVTDEKGNIVGYVTYNAKFSNSPEGYDFAHNEENYYKLLEDFNVYDSLEEVRSGKKIPALQEAVTLKYAGENGAVLSEEQLNEYAEDLRNTGVFSENEINKYVAKAQMTWDEILHKELEGRNEYHKQQDPKLDSAVKQIEDMLLSKYARTGRASDAKSYIKAKEKAGKQLSKKKGTTEEKTEKANEASLMPPEGVYLRSERLLFSDRDTSLDPRTLLTNALENAAVTEDEKNLLKAYKNQIDILNKQTKRLAEIKAEIKDISFGKGKDRSKLPGLEESARKFERAISAKDKQLLKLEATTPLQKVLDREKAAVKKKALQKGREDLKTFKEKAAEKLQKEVARRIEQRDTMRQEKYDALQKQRDEYKQREETKRGRRDMTYYRDEIKKIREDFIQQLRNGTDRRFVPKPLVESIISVCNAIDPTGRVYYKPGTNEVDIERTRAEYEFAKGESKAVEKYLTGKQALADLKLAYDNLSSDNDYDFSSEYDAEFSGLIAQLADSIGDTPLREMSLEQLSDVYNILSDIRWMLKDAARQIGVGETITNYEAGQQLISEMEEIKNLGLTTSKVSDKFRELTLNPMRAVRDMSAFDDNAMLVKLFNALNEGRRKADTFRMKTDKKIEAVRDEDRKAYNDAVEKEFDFGLVDIHGNEVHITKMQAMFAVLTARREAANANRSHLQTPVLFPDYKLEKKGKFGEAKRRGVEVRIDGNAVAKIMDGLSAWDKRYLAVAEKIYNEDCKNAVNETTMLTKHRAVATENSYIQYVVNEDYIARDSENVKFDKTILNEGILKSVKDNADQQLIMLSLNTALDDHIEKVAKLYGLAVPIRNWNKVFNMKQAKGYVGDNVKSVKSAIFETWGEKSRDILDQAVADLQTSRQSNKVNNEAEKVLQKVRSGMTVSVLASNISVAMKQAASYPTAGSILSSYALLKGLKDYSAKIKDGVHAQDVYDEIDAHTSQHWIRRQGLSTQELGELNQSNGWENRLNNKLGKASPMNWIQAIDVGTTAALWYACKVDARRAGYAEGSREYWDKVTELYDKVIEETQPMYDSLHRAEITKGNELVKSMVMFKTQPLQNSGILREGGMELKVAYKKYGKNSEQAKEARMKFVKAVASQAASHFVFTAMTLVSRMLLHKMNSYRDDDDELTFGSIASEFASQYFRNFFGAIVPIVGDVATSIADALIKKGNSTALNSFVVDKVNEIVNAFSKLDEPSVENYTDMLGEIASFFGIPFSNATNIVKGAILHIEDAVNGEFGSFNAGQSGSYSGNAKKYVKLISDGNAADAKDLYNEWVSEKKETIRANREKDGKTELSDSELEKEAKSSVKSSISSYFREMYVEAYKNGDTETTGEIRKQMLATGLWTDPKKTSASVVNKTCNDWEKEYKKPQ